MKQAYRVILLLMPIFPALLQEQQHVGGFRLKTKYDRVTDTTTVQCDLVEPGDLPAKLSVQAEASFRGKEPNETAEFRLFLSSNRGGATRHTKPLFREAATLYLTMDSTRMEIPVKDYRSDFFELVRSYAESARAEIRHEELQKLLDAKSLEGKWGGVEFKFSDAALASLKDFVSRQVFAAHTR